LEVKIDGTLVKRVISAQSSFIEWPIRIEGKIPLSSWWLVVQFVQITLQSEITLCNSMTTCLPSCSVGSPSWMASFDSIFGGRGRPIVWRDLLRIVRSLRW
jgi:hypothetical protein